MRLGSCPGVSDHLQDWTQRWEKETAKQAEGPVSSEFSWSKGTYMSSAHCLQGASYMVARC